jgi:hypothetical protein
MLPGKVTDYGDLLHVEQWIVKGRHRRWVWRTGPHTDASPDDRVRGASTEMSTGKVDAVMDLMSDKKVTLSGQWTDEMGNPVDTPAEASVVFTNDNADVIALTDNGDGSATAAALGALGTANIHAVAASPSSGELTADLQIVVVAGLAERFNITASEPEETD